MIFVRGKVKLMEKSETKAGKEMYRIKVLDERNFDSMGLVSYDKDDKGHALKPSVPMDVEVLILVDIGIMNDKPMFFYKGYELASLPKSKS